MRILFFDTKSYDRASFDKQLEHYPGIEIDYLKTDRSGTENSAFGKRL